MTVENGLGGLCAGVDIGGTAVRVVTWAGGRCIDALTVPTAEFAAGSEHERVRRLAGLLSGLLPDRGSIAAVGIGASGPVDVDRGVIENPYTLPAFSHFPIVAALEAELGCPVIIESDAVVAAVAEHRVGAGRRAERMAMVTLGTGIGVCLLVDGRPFRGPGGAHPEGGHIPIVSGDERCYCGIMGCWEQVGSRSALQKRLVQLLPAGTPSDLILHEAAAVAETDDCIRDAFTAYGRLVGRGLCTLQTMYMPDVTVLGGSAAAHLDLIRTGMEQELERPADFIRPMEVRGAMLGEAGAIGAALLAEQRLGDPRTAASSQRTDGLLP